MHVERSRRKAESQASQELIPPAEEQVAQIAEKDVATEVVQNAHESLGNTVVAAALGGGEGGFGGFVAEQVELGLGGVAGPMADGAAASNAAMLAAMRDAQEEGLDLGNPAVRAIGQMGARALPESIAQRMGAAFGHDFTGVRVHTGGRAAEASAALNARAFTIGREIYFGAGEFAPGTPEGDRLLAHELTHVVQHDEGRLPDPTGDGLDVSSPTDAAEREAYANEDQITDLLGGASNLPISEGAAAAPEASPVAGAFESADAGTAMRELDEPKKHKLDAASRPTLDLPKLPFAPPQAQGDPRGSGLSTPTRPPDGDSLALPDPKMAQIVTGDLRKLAADVPAQVPGMLRAPRLDPKELLKGGKDEDKSGKAGKDAREAKDAKADKDKAKEDREKGRGAGADGKDGKEARDGKEKKEGEDGLDEARGEGGPLDGLLGEGGLAVPGVLGDVLGAGLAGGPKAALNAAGGAAMGMMGGGPGGPGGEQKGPEVRELPGVGLKPWKVDKKTDMGLQKKTGLNADQHRQKIEDHLRRIREQVDFLRTELQKYADDKKTELAGSLGTRAADTSGRVAAAATEISGAYAAAKARVTAAAAAARTRVETDATTARGQLDGSLPAKKAKLEEAYNAAKTKLDEQKTGFAKPFETAVDEGAKAVQKTGETKSGELAAQKDTIVATWDGGGSYMERAENDARRNAAKKGIDDAIKDFKAGALAKAEEIRKEKPNYLKQVDDLLLPLTTKVESIKTEGGTKLQAAYDKGVAQIDTDKTDANGKIGEAETTASTTLASGEETAKKEVESAGTKLEGDINSSLTSTQQSIDSTGKSLADRYTDWMKGVVDGIPKDQPMPYDTARQFLEQKERELAGFHQGLLDELTRTCDTSRATLEQTITTQLGSIDTLKTNSATEAGTIADKQCGAIDSAAGKFGESMKAVGGAVDAAFDAFIAPLQGDMDAFVGKVKTDLDAKVTEAKAKILEVDTTYAASLDERIKTMPTTLKPMVDAAAKKLRPDLEKRAQRVHTACKGLGTDENGVYNALRNLTPNMGKALEYDVWPGLFSAEGGLTAFLKDDMSGKDLEIALAYLAGNTAAAARMELDNCIHWYGDDEAQIETILRDLSPEDREKMKAMPEWKKTEQRLKDNLGGTDLDVTNALIAGNVARADAYRLKESIDNARRDGDPDALHKALEGVPPDKLKEVQQEFYNIQNGVKAEQTNVPPVDQAKAAAALADYSTKEFKTGDPYYDQMMNKKFGGANKDLTRALATEGQGSESASVARFEVERTREGGPNMENLEKALYAPPDLQEQLHSPNEEVRKKAEKEQAERKARLEAKYQEQYGKNNGLTMGTAIDGMFKGNEKEQKVKREMTKNMLADGTNSPRVAADMIWLMGKNKTGTDEAAIKRSLAGMRPDEIKTLQQVYAKEHGDGDPQALYKDLGVVERNEDGSRKKGGDHSGWGSELSGDDRREVEELLMGDPKYMDPKQQLALARLQKDWTIGEESTGVGRFVMGATNEKKDLERNYNALENVATKMKPDGTFADPKDREEFERLCRATGINADQYRAASDRVANYATTTVAVVGAAVITVATAGAGAPAAVAMVGAAATGGASMAINYSMKGGRYGWEQAVTDAGVTAVSVATAGVGAKLNTLKTLGPNGEVIGEGILKSGTAMGKAAGQGIVGMGTGFANGTAQTAMTDGTWDKGFSQGLKETAIGGVKQAAVEGVTGFVSTGIDENAAMKKFAEKGVVQSAINAGINNGVGGMAGAATGIGIDKMRGKYKGESWDFGEAILKEGATQGLGGAAGGAFAKHRYGATHDMGVDGTTAKPDGGTTGIDKTTPPPGGGSTTVDSGHPPPNNGGGTSAVKAETGTVTPKGDGASVAPKGSGDTAPTTDGSGTARVKPTDTAAATDGATGAPKETAVAPRPDTTTTAKPTDAPIVQKPGADGVKANDPAVKANEAEVKPGESDTGKTNKDANTSKGQTNGDEGAQVKVNEDGEITVKTKDRMVIGDETGVMSLEKDGTLQIQNKDGTTTIVEPNGTKKTMTPDGDVIVEKNGKKTIIRKDGEVVPLDNAGHPVDQDQGSSNRTAEDRVYESLDSLLKAGKISDKQAYMVLEAGDAAAQQKALTELTNRIKQDDATLNRLVELTGQKGPDGKPLLSQDAALKVLDAADPAKALRVVEADLKNQAQDQKVADDIAGRTVKGADGKLHVEGVFDNITMGEGFAGISNEMSLPSGKGDKTLVVGLKNPWLDANSRLGQPAGESELPNVKPGNTMKETAQTGNDRYMHAKEHAENVEINRADQGIGVYGGRVLAIDPKGSFKRTPEGWPDGANVRMTVVGPDGQSRYIYAKNVDIAGGPGSARQLDSKGPDAQIHPQTLKDLKAQGVILDGDQSFDPSTVKPGEKVVVYGAGASGAWSAELAAKAKGDVSWVGRQAGADDMPKLTPNQQKRLQEILDRVSGTTKGTPDHEAAMKDLEKFTFTEMPANGFLPRNKDKGAAFDPDMQGQGAGKIDRQLVPDIEKVEYEWNPQARKMQVKITPQGGGDPIWCDRLVTSIGQEANLTGGPARLLKSVPELVPIIDASGRNYPYPVVVGLQSPDGSIRVMGVAATNRSVTAKVKGSDVGGTTIDKNWVNKNLEMQANDPSVPQDSRSVVGSFNHAMKMIGAANRDDLVNLLDMSPEQQSQKLGGYEDAVRGYDRIKNDLSKDAPELKDGPTTPTPSRDASTDTSRTPPAVDAQGQTGTPRKRWDDPSMTRDEFIADYKSKYPKSELSDAQLGERFDAGQRLNPDTGRLKVPERAPTDTPPSGKKWDDPALTRDEFIADYKARYPKTTLSDDQLGARFDAGQRLNPETGRLAKPGGAEDTGAKKNTGTDPVGPDPKVLPPGATRAPEPPDLVGPPAGRALQTAKKGDTPLIGLSSDFYDPKASAAESAAKLQKEGIPRYKALTADERAVESKFADQVQQDPQKALEGARRLAEAAGSKDQPVFEVDAMKRLLEDYGMGARPATPEEAAFRLAQNHAMHPTAVAIARLAFTERLDFLRSLPDGHPQKQIFVTNGGCAAGKGDLTGIVKNALGDQGKFGAVWDAAGEGDGLENMWILKAAQERGIKVVFGYAEADPVQRYENVLGRAGASGRVVDVLTFVNSYSDGAKAFKDFLQSPEYLQAVADGNATAFGVAPGAFNKASITDKSQAAYPNVKNLNATGGKLDASMVADPPNKQQALEASLKILEDYVAKARADGKNPDDVARGALTNALKFLDGESPEVRAAVLRSYAKIFGGGSP